MANYPANFRHVVEGIYAGAAPTIKDIEALKSLNIKYVLSLDETAGALIGPLLNTAKIQQILIPIEPVPYMTDNLKYLIRNITRIMQYQPLFIHCQHGKDRTGLVIALYRVLKFGFTPDQALSEARRYGYGVGISPQTQQFWSNILKVLATTKNTSDVGAADDDFGSHDFREAIHGSSPFPYIDSPSNIRAPDYSNTNLIYTPYSSEGRISALKAILNDTIPAIGISNNIQSLPGAGPTETPNYFTHQDLER